MNLGEGENELGNQKVFKRNKKLFHIIFKDVNVFY